jgi:hypothetical protein
MERFFCLDCRTLDELNHSGRCATCNSEAVVSEHHQRREFGEYSLFTIERAERARKEFEVSELQRMFSL